MGLHQAGDWSPVGVYRATFESQCFSKTQFLVPQYKKPIKLLDSVQRRAMKTGRASRRSHKRSS